MNKLKLKPYYFYGLLLLIIIVILYLSSESTTTSTKLTSTNTAENNLPNDSIHKNLGIQPGKSNVNSDVMKKMDEMKKLADAVPVDTLRIREYADFLLAAHKPDEAIKYYNKILNINKKRKDILQSLTLAFYNKGDLKNAEETILQTLKFFPDDPESNYNLGAIEASKGNYDKAFNIWKKLIAKYPKSEISNLAKNSLDKL